MKVVRTFHTVGQGAFYSERFYEDGLLEASYNIVYDCGVANGCGYKRKSERVVKQAFNKDDEIDYLFLSHLDYDHISLVKTLVSCVKRVKNIVLPLISDDEIIIAIAYYKIFDFRFEAGFLNKIREALSKTKKTDSEDGGFIILSSEGRADKGVIEFSGASIKNRDDSIRPGWIPEWVFIPYNVNCSARRQELKERIEDLFQNQDFVGDLNRISNHSIQNADVLFDWLKNEQFVEEVIGNSFLGKSLREAYKSVAGGINENSLLLYSGPASSDSHFEVREVFPFRYNWHYHLWHNSGCLYTGDCSFDINFWKSSAFPSVWNNIGVIQIPHHGSLKSFDIASNPIDRQYLMPVSCGTSNSFSHPSGKVLAYLLTQSCFPHIVSEQTNTLLMIEIVG